MSSDQQMSEDDLKFQQAKAYLMQADPEGQSTYDHLHALVAEMLEANPNDVVHHPEKVAALSAQFKKHKFVTGDAAKSANSAPVTHHTQLTAATANKDLFSKAQTESKTVVEKPTPYTTVTTTTIVPKAAPQFKSLVAENAMWKHCGVALPDHEAFLLDQSVSRLAGLRQLEEVRFVGKIFGLDSNYIVISSKRFVAEDEKVYEEVYAMPKAPRKKVEVDVQAEPGFKGCNRVSFWVTPDANSTWTLLPDISPQEINAARQVRKFFTGDLKATVNAHPAFVGSEAVYLRAQLSRILASTFIAPLGVLDKPDDDEAEEADEDEEDGKPKGPKPAKYFPLTKLNKEFEGESTAALADPEQWVHSESYIYQTGRQTKIPEKPETEEEEEVIEEEEDENEEEKKEEEEKELFLPIKGDASYAIIHIPKEPSPEDEDEEIDAEPEADAEGEEGDKSDDEKEEEEEEIADDDPLRKKIPAWTTRQTNTVYKNHAVVVVRSLRWPGAVAYASQKGKSFGSVYFGWGFKKTDTALTPTAASEIIKEADDIVEVADPTAGNEKLVMRGEDPKEADSEDEKDEDEDEEEEN